MAEHTECNDDRKDQIQFLLDSGASDHIINSGLDNTLSRTENTNQSISGKI